MKKTLVYLAIAAALSACHRGSSGTLTRKDQQQYDVVQEGQASGVTSTINGPGDVAPPPAPMTGTNADTTSNFTLPQVATNGAQPGQPGTLAGTLPQNTPGSMVSSYPAAPPRPHTTTTATTTHTTTELPSTPTRPAEPQRTQPARPTPPPSTTVEGPPPSTSTVPPNTDTAPPPPPSNDTPAPKSDQKKDKNKDNNPPTQTDTQPPPTTTT